MRSTILISLASLSQACVSLQSISTSQIPPKGQRSKLVKVETTRFSFLGIPFGYGVVKEAAAKLANACPNARIEGVVAKQETNPGYFLLLLSKDTITMSGYCQSPPKPKVKA